MRLVQRSDSFTRPSGTTQYTSGDLVANHGTAGSVVPLDFTFKGFNFIKLVRVHLTRSAATVTDAQFRIHLYKDSPTVANGDNAAWSTTPSNYIGFVDVDSQTPTFTGTGTGSGVPVSNSVYAPMSIVLDVDKTIYALIEARDTYTPASEEVFTVTLVAEAFV